jgi:hypothetical protein
MSNDERLNEALKKYAVLSKAQGEEILELKKSLVLFGQRCCHLHHALEFYMAHLGVDEDARGEIKAKAHNETNRLMIIENLKMDYECTSAGEMSA